MGYQGRAVVVDPDVFAVGDVCELLSPRHAGQGDPLPHAQRHQAPVRGNYASSVMLLDCAKLSTGGSRPSSTQLFTFKRDYRRLDQPAGRGSGHDRRARAGVERFRPSERQDQDAAQHPAQDPALEDRPAGRLHAGRDLPAVPAVRLADAGAPPAVRRLRPARPLPEPSRPPAGAAVLRPAARVPRAGDRQPRSFCARRCAATTSATTLSS